MKKILLIGLFAVMGVINALAQSKLSADQLKEDLATLGDIIVGLSPKLTEEGRIRLNDLIQVKKQELTGSTLTPMEFFNYLSEIDFDTKFDEHASLSLTEEVLMPLLTKSKLFPIPIKMIGTSMVVNSSDLEIPYGSKIYAINGTRIDELLNSFSKEYKDTFVKRRLEAQFSIIHLIKEGSFEDFQIVYTTPDDHVEKIERSIAGIDFDTYRNVFSKTVFPLGQPTLRNLFNTHFYKETRTFYLQLNSFNWDNRSKKGLFHFLNSEHKNFDKRLSNIFEEVSDSGAQNLIIDLRYNSGGNVKVPGVLYSYIAKDTFTEDIKITMQNFDIPHTELVSKISGDEVKKPKEVEKFINLYEKQFDKQGDDTHLWTLVDNELRNPSDNAFKGNVYLLVSGYSISASAYFAALFKSRDRGLIIGEEMGGSYRSLSAGQILTYQIPHSKIELEVPIMEVNFSNQLYEVLKVDRIKPDMEFDEAARFNYFLEKKDIEIEKVLDYIKANTQEP